MPSTHSPSRPQLARRAAALALTLAAAVACSSGRTLEPTAARDGELAVVSGRVLYGADQAVAHAVVTALAHRNVCGSPGVIARATTPSSGNGGFNVRLAAPPADSLCVVLHAEWSLGTSTRTADETVVVRRRAPAGVYDTARVDLLLQ